MTNDVIKELLVAVLTPVALLFFVRIEVVHSIFKLLLHPSIAYITRTFCRTTNENSIVAAVPTLELCTRKHFMEAYDFLIRCFEISFRIDVASSLRGHARRLAVRLTIQDGNDLSTIVKKRLALDFVKGLVARVLSPVGT